MTSRAALLVVDVQNDFVHPSGKVGNATGDVSVLLSTVESINELIAAARDAEIPIIYIRVTHSPELDNPAYRARYAKRGMSVDDLLCAADTWGAEFYDGLAPPMPHDLVMTKHGYGAFASDDLAEYLRKNSVDTVIVAGVVTELCVLSTVSGGFEHGFHVIVPRETTSSVEPKAAEAALELIEKFYGIVPDLDEMVTVLENADSAQI